MTPGDTSRRAVVLFTKPAVAGRVKTRLVGDLSPEDAARLHAAFVRDTSTELARGEFDLYVAWALDGGLAPEPGLLPSGVQALEQTGDDLGARLHAALADLAQRGYDAVAAVGSDHPGLPASRLTEAFERLAADADVVWGPVPDGGYDLVAVRRRALRSGLFRDIAWSTASVLVQSLERARELGLRTACLEPGFDVDTPEDLDQLVTRLGRKPESECPETRRALAGLGLLSPRGAMS